MKIISFAWTSDALLAGRKTRTRREWVDDYAATFKPGDLVQAWDRLPRVKGAKRIGTVKILKIAKEDIRTMPEEDFEREGFAYMAEKGRKIWGEEPREAFNRWRLEGGRFWVVDFELAEPPPLSARSASLREYMTPF